MTKVDVVTEGELIKNIPLGDCHQRLQQSFKLNKAQIDVLTSGRPITLKKGVPLEIADKYVGKLSQCGLKADVELSRVEENLSPYFYKIEQLPEPIRNKLNIARYEIPANLLQAKMLLTPRKVKFSNLEAHNNDIKESNFEVISYSMKTTMLMLFSLIITMPVALYCQRILSAMGLPNMIAVVLGVFLIFSYCLFCFVALNAGKSFTLSAKKGDELLAVRLFFKSPIQKEYALFTQEGESVGSIVASLSSSGIYLTNDWGDHLYRVELEPTVANQSNQVAKDILENSLDFNYLSEVSKLLLSLAAFVGLKVKQNMSDSAEKWNIYSAQEQHVAKWEVENNTIKAQVFTDSETEKNTALMLICFNAIRTML